MTHHRIPPMEKSEEATPEQLEMAREQGNRYVEALNHMVNKVADDGGEVRAGDYIVAYAVEKAEGMYRMSTGTLEFQKPDQENIHIEVSVRDGADNRFVPGLNVQVTLIAPDGKKVGTHEQPFVWHPWLYHYGRNWTVEQSGTYKMHVEIAAPQYPRHDPKNGQRYAATVKVEFDSVKIEPKKKSTDHSGQPNAKDSQEQERVQIWVSPHDEYWRVHEAGNDYTHAEARTQREAIEIARGIAKEKQAELLVQGEDGKIRERNSYGNDPNPPKG